ncbi:MAG: hypothetical protein A2Z72_01005 [Omnitrophica bacterium RBG_13_46_9]|nr:MAG: hypothetical protein A2Z72_01005 [Omnitrophica bacterium RBG_13_46_9]
MNSLTQQYRSNADTLVQNYLRGEIEDYRDGVYSMADSARSDVDSASNPSSHYSNIANGFAGAYSTCASTCNEIEYLRGAYSTCSSALSSLLSDVSNVENYISDKESDAYSALLNAQSKLNQADSIADYLESLLSDADYYYYWSKSTTNIGDLEYMLAATEDIYYYANSEYYDGAYVATSKLVSESDSLIGGAYSARYDAESYADSECNSILSEAYSIISDYAASNESLNSDILAQKDLEQEMANNPIGEKSAYEEKVETVIPPR